jgi:hypothetical protein
MLIQPRRQDTDVTVLQLDPRQRQVLRLMRRLRRPHRAWWVATIRKKNKDVEGDGSMMISTLFTDSGSFLEKRCRRCCTSRGWCSGIFRLFERYCSSKLRPLENFIIVIFRKPRSGCQINFVPLQIIAVRLDGSFLGALCYGWL